MVYYLGYYDCYEIAEEKRTAAPPAINKMGYIISVLSEVVNEKTMVINPSETTVNKYIFGKTRSLNSGISIKTFGSFQSKCKIIRGFGHLWTKAQVLAFLMSNVKCDDTLIVYHSLSLMKIVGKVKKCKKCNLIIEVEELYSDVTEDAKLRKKEIKYLQIADKYIVITELLNKDINLENKPKIISHGTYKTVPKCSEKNNDGKIHVVYAGTFDPIKGGVYVAIETAEYLNEKYVLHILGKGNEAETNAVVEKIKQTEQKTKCKIVFDGYKSGKEFDAFIQSCHIGLSTQQPGGKYNASSFPSKILMYMSNGLHVVSVRIPAVVTSEVGKHVHYYDSQHPLAISEAIKNITFDDGYNSSVHLNDLHDNFSKQLSKLLKR